MTPLWMLASVVLLAQLSLWWDIKLPRALCSWPNALLSLIFDYGDTSKQA
jgi:hypothetical protein